MNKTKSDTRRCDECWEDLLENGSRTAYHDIASLDKMPQKMLDYLVEKSFTIPLIYERMLNRKELNSEQRILYLEHMFKTEEIDYIWISKQLTPNSEKFHNALAKSIRENPKKINTDIIHEISYHISNHIIWKNLTSNAQKTYTAIIKKSNNLAY